MDPLSRDRLGRGGGAHRPGGGGPGGAGQAGAGAGGGGGGMGKKSSSTSQLSAAGRVFNDGFFLRKGIKTAKKMHRIHLLQREVLANICHNSAGGKVVEKS